MFFRSASEPADAALREIFPHMPTGNQYNIPHIADIQAEAISVGIRLLPFPYRLCGILLFLPFPHCQPAIPVAYSSSFLRKNTVHHIVQSDGFFLSLTLTCRGTAPYFPFT